MFISKTLQLLAHVDPHPAKKILRKQYDVPVKIIARWLPASLSHTYQMLNGDINTTEKFDKRFWELVEIVRKEAKK